VAAQQGSGLISWAAEFAPAATNGYQSQAAQRRAVMAVLDTLIQENVQVPIPVIGAVAGSFPSQAVILIARLPRWHTRVQPWASGLME
jgi:hypothetical protein